MKPRLTVAIFDDNLFFKQGIEYLLKHHFLHQGITLHFVTPHHCGIVDLFILAEQYEDDNYLWCFREALWRQKNALIITVTDSVNRHRITHPYCRCERRWIDRHDTPQAALTLIDWAQAQIETGHTVHDSICRCCIQTPLLTLTLRERDVLRKIAGGFSPIRIAYMLNISEKTVSAHKRTAMRKLGFRRSNELYQWLQLRPLNTSI